MKISTAIIAATSLLSVAAVQAEENKWEFSGEIYGIGANITGQSRIGGENIPTQDTDVSFGDILDVLDAAAMFHTEGLYNDTWGYAFDYGMMDLSKDIVFGDKASASSNAFQSTTELKGFKRMHYDFGTIDYMAGVRWWNTRADLTVSKDNTTSPEAKLDEDWVDFVIGTRLNMPIHNDWNYYLDVDMGAGKDTRFTSQVLTGFKYHINEWSDLRLGYKALYVDYDNKESFAYDTTTHGFMVGYIVNF